jgi:hypothetical protein
VLWAGLFFDRGQHLKSFMSFEFSQLLPESRTNDSRIRAGGIRTHDLLNPIQALYQAEPRPVFSLLELNGTPANAIAFFRLSRVPGSGGANGPLFRLIRHAHGLFDTKLRDKRKMI